MKVSKLMIGMFLGAAALAAGAFVALPLVARAQTPTPQTTTPATGQGQLGPHKGFGAEGGLSVKDLIDGAALQTGLTGPEVLTQLQNGQTLTQVAESKGKTADAVIKAGRGLLADRLALSVKIGWITQAQADAALAQFDANAPQLMTSTSLGGRGLSRGAGGLGDFGAGGDRGRGHGGPRGRGGLGGDEGLLTATASVTGLTAQEITTQLASGQSLAQIAAAKGKTADAVIKAARTALEEKLKAAVTAGQLTQAQADAHLAQFDQSAPQIMADTTLGQRFQHEWRLNPNQPTTPATPAPSTSNTSVTW